MQYFYIFATVPFYFQNNKVILKRLKLNNIFLI